VEGIIQEIARKPQKLTTYSISLKKVHFPSAVLHFPSINPYLCGMRFYSKALILLSLIFVLFNSCKNDLKILAPYKEAISVYAILSPGQSEGYGLNLGTKYYRQYIRINKIYLGEGNAYDMATVSDSVNYPHGVLEVSLTRTYYGVPAGTTVGNSTKMEIILKDTVIQLSPGSFNTNQRLWYTDDSLHTDGEYSLKIRNTITGNVFTSKSVMISPIITPGIIQPLGGPYYPVPFSASNPSYYYLDLSNQNIVRTVKFNSIKNARDYSCIIRFNYIDSTVSGNISKSIDYEFTRVSSTSLDGSEPLQFTYTSAEFFSTVAGKIVDAGDPPGFLARRLIDIEYSVTAGAQDFADFIKISAPSTSIAQDKPAYSNIDGGFGIFSCRSTFKAPKHLANATFDYVASKKPLCSLRFVNSSGNISPTCN
jgi:hypothetical protein